MRIRGSMLIESIKNFQYDFNELVKILNSSVSFMDRVDSTGVLRRKLPRISGSSDLLDALPGYLRI